MKQNIKRAFMGIIRSFIVSILIMLGYLGFGIYYQEKWYFMFSAFFFIIAIILFLASLYDTLNSKEN